MRIKLRLKHLKRKISELEHQIQTRESIIKNLSLANEMLLQENSDLRKKINSDQVTSKKAKNCTGGIQYKTLRVTQQAIKEKVSPVYLSQVIAWFVT